MTEDRESHAPQPASLLAISRVLEETARMLHDWALADDPPLRGPASTDENKGGYHGAKRAYPSTYRPAPDPGPRDLVAFSLVHRAMAERRCLSILSPLLLVAAACDRPPDQSTPGPEAAPKAGPNGAATGPRLALLKPSGDTLMAALEGILHAEGPCLYIVGKDPKRNRTLPAFHIAGMSWDEATRTLRVRDKSFALGQRVVLGGGHVPNHPALDWVQPPDPSCDSSDLFMTGTIDTAEAGPGR